MEFLKSTLTSALSKGPPFPYTFGDCISRSSDTDSTGVFTLHNGTSRADSSPCSIFSFDITDTSRSRLPLAKNALRKLRTLRHPGVVRVLESVEKTDTCIYIATERVTPVSWHVKRNALQTETVKWGLWGVATTIKFLNEEAKSVHGNVRLESVFTSESGEWKVAGFEVMSCVMDDEPFIYRYGGLLPDAARYAAPEIGQGGWEGLKSQPIHVTDSWGFGALIYQAFNGGSFTSTDQLSQPKKIPPAMGAAYKRLIAANPKSRLSVAHFLEQGCRANSFFDIPLIHISQFVENMGVKDQTEREAFLDELESTGDQFPEDFFKMKVLPELLKSVEFSGGGPKVFGAVLRIGEKLSAEEWEASISPVVVRLFALPDRATRVFLLDNLGTMIEHLSNRVVNDKIFPDMLLGFSDAAPIMREQTVKAVLTIITKLSDRHINGDLLKHLAKTQNDVEPGIRTNTTICLGKIARYLGPHTRQKVLVAAFTRSLRDPFVPARNAALLALAATADVFDASDCASKVVPAISPSLVDQDKSTRKQAAKTLDQYLLRIRTLTESFPDTADTTTTPAASASATATVVQLSGWTSWAFSAATTRGTIQPTKPAPTPEPERPASVPGVPVARPETHTAARTSPLPVAPGGFIDDAEEEEDNDDLDGWGALDDDFGDPTPPPPRQQQQYKKENKLSTFGPKPFRPPPEEVVDFEALVTRKAPLPKGLAAKKEKPVVLGAKKAPVKTVQADWDEGDGWGDEWN